MTESDTGFSDSDMDMDEQVHETKAMSWQIHFNQGIYDAW